MNEGDPMVEGLASLVRGTNIRSGLGDDALIGRAMLAGAARHRRHRLVRAGIGGGVAIAIAAAALIALWPASSIAPLPGAPSPAAPIAAAPMTSARLPSGDVLTAREGTRFYVEADTITERRVRMDSGAMLFDVRPLGHGSRFEVHTPHLVISVVGTVFEVVVDEGGTIVRVFEGRVRAGAHLVAAGEEYAVGRAPRLDPRLAEQGRAAAIAREHANARPENTVEPVALAERPSGAAPEEDVQLAEPRARRIAPALAEQRSALAREENAPRVSTNAAEGNAPEGNAPEGNAPEGNAPPARVTVAELRRMVANGNARGALELLPQARAQGASEADLFFVEGDALRRLDRTREAADAYDAAASALPPGERENAGFIAATLRLRRLRDPQRALRSLDTSGALEAHSPLRERAMVLSVAAHQMMGNTFAAREAAREYLSLFPNGSSAGEMRSALAQ